MTRPGTAVFLDRDGTINEEVDYLKTPEELRLLPGAAQAIRSLNHAGMATCVISNQSGVARGVFTEDDLRLIHDKLEGDLRAEGAVIDRIYYCPHHPTEGSPPYNIVCDCRKPSPGMLLRGKEELAIDLNRSFVVGDSIVDIRAGQAVGARTILVLTGYGRTMVKECARDGVTPDYIAPSIVEAVRYILEHNANSPS